jgi:sporulation protein YlmC with PRC-barrel domain
MLRLMTTLSGCKISAKDGTVGKVKDFLFDEENWTVRWLVADTGRWLPGRKVLISPLSLKKVDWTTQTFDVRMTQKEIENAPALDEDAPVSREYERRWYDAYGYPYYWGTADLHGASAAPIAGMETTSVPEPEKLIEEPPPEEETVLRSVKEVDNYHIQAADGAIGHIEDFVMDDETWTIRYLVVDTRNWLPGRKVLLAPAWIGSIHWIEKDVTTPLSRDAIKAAPEFDPTVPVNREYEVQLYDYYGRPVYWEE